MNVTEEDTVPAGAGAVQCEIQGNLEKITGCIEEKYLDTDSRIYIRLNHNKIYEAFPMDAYIWTVHFLQQTEIRSKFLQTTKIQPV